MKIELELDLPQEIIDQVSQRDLEDACRTEVILRLFAQQKIVPVEATRLLGLTRIGFHQLLEERGVPFVVDLDDKDEEMLRTLRDRYTVPPE